MCIPGKFGAFPGGLCYNLCRHWRAVDYLERGFCFAKYLFTYSNDVEAITTALTVLPGYDFFSSDIAESALAVAASAGQKLIMKEKLSQRENAFIALAVDSAYKALRNELNLEGEYLLRLQPYLFVYNKLQPVFSPFLPE